MDLLLNLLYYMGMLLPPLEFIGTGAAPNYRSAIDKVFSGYYGIQFADAGGVELTIGDRSYTLEEKWCWCTYPGPHFMYRPSKQHGYWSHYFVTFRGPRLNDWISDGLLPFAPQQLPSSTDFATRIETIRMLIDSANRLSVLTAVNELEKMLIDLAIARTGSADRPAWLQLLVRQLNDSVDQQPDYQGLAVEYGMSVSTLRRQFKRFAGMPIHTYLLRRRISAACDILTHTDLPVNVIANRLGYSDTYFFSRQFHQLIGCTPSSFRHPGNRDT